VSSKKSLPSLKEVALFLWAIPLVALGSLAKTTPGSKWTALMGEPGTPSLQDTAGSESSSLASDSRERELGVAIKRAAYYLPGTHKCLAQAIAGQMMLSSLGIPGTVIIGLKPDPSGPWDGHAWLMGQSGIIVGGEIANHYTPVTAYRKSARHGGLAGD
jgi:hypothetical protein